MILFADALAALEQRGPVRKQGHNWRAACPAHDDRHPSLDLAEGNDGAALLICRSAGCSFDAIVAALGLEPGRGSRPDEPLAVYRYADEHDKPLFEVVRKPGKEFPQRRPDGSWGVRGVRRVLYRLSRVVEAVEAGETIYVPEGEKDVHALERLGLVATCNPGGAKKWNQPGYSDSLAGATRVVVLVDDDQDGRDHAAQVTAALHGRVAELKVVELYPPGQTKRDVSNWIADRGEDAAAALEALVGQTPPAGPEQMTGSTSDEELRIVTDREFAAVDEPGAGAVVGSADNPLFPESGNVMGYGDGGVGKTTLFVDLAYHLAAGDDWLGIPIRKPRRVLLVECEGPRPLFRRKIRRKRDAWTGSDPGDRVLVAEGPWAKFTFADADWRQRLADQIAQLEVDVALVGPITNAGMDLPGTIQECREFVALVDDVRSRSGRVGLAILLVHHENRTGKVSGAWEGVVDTLLHVTGQGHGKLRLYVQKAKWASDLHATGLQLAWAPGDSFTVEDKPELDDDAVARLILDAVRADPGTGWTRVEEQTPGVRREGRREVRDRLLREGVIVNVGKDEGGAEVALDHCPERKPARLYPADDPTIQHLRPDPGAAGAQPAPAGGEGAGEPLRPAPRPIGAQGAGAQPDTPLNLVDDDELERLADLARDLEEHAR